MPPEGTPRITYSPIPGQYADGAAYELAEPHYTIEDLAYGPVGETLVISARVAPQMIGLGLLEAIPEADLLALADPDDADGDGISGKANRVYDKASDSYVVGRFGWKSEQPSVRQQVAGAFLGDLGITSSLFPDQDCTETELECQGAPDGGAPEISDDLLDRVVVYSQLVAVPIRSRWDDDVVLRGKRLFEDLGCDGCHTPNHVTGESSLDEVSHQEIWPYTDLLLHDMGEALSDARPAFDANGREWRTPPLWGIGRIHDVNGHDRLLHDGRARGTAEAILWHGGEAETSRDGFVSLPESDRTALVEFVESL